MSLPRFNPSRAPAAPKPPPQAAPRIDYPALTKANLQDARLYADRHDLVANLGIRQGGIVVELGVAFGSFSKVLIEALRPAEFVAIDIFELHKAPSVWGRPTSEVFKSMTHHAFYTAQFAKAATRMTILQGLSHVRLAEFPDQHFDLIYVDADHTYEAVKADAEVAKRKLRRDGALIFNDYILYDHVAGIPYGVVPVVNQLVALEGWRVVGFALQHQLFCDIALRPPVASRAG